jgi:hypothetical protein
MTKLACFALIWASFAAQKPTILRCTGFELRPKKIRAVKICNLEMILIVEQDIFRSDVTVGEA